MTAPPLPTARGRQPARPIRLAAVALGLAVVGAVAVGVASIAAASAAPGTRPVPRSLQSGTPDPRLGLQQCSAPSTTVVPYVPWTQTRLGVARAWKLSTGVGVTVAVIDTGVDATVPQ